MLLKERFIASRFQNERQAGKIDLTENKDKFNINRYVSIGLSVLAVWIMAGGLYVNDGRRIFPEALAQIQDDQNRDQIEKKIQQLEEESKVLDAQLQKIQGESRSLTTENKVLETEVRKRELEIRRLALSVSKTDFEINQRTAKIEDASKRIAKNQKALTASLFLLYMYDQDNSLIALLKNKSISDYFSKVNNIEKTQDSIEEKMRQFREDKVTFENEKAALKDVLEEQQSLKALQEVERRMLAQKKKEKDELLRLTRGKESVFQQLLKSKKKDISSLKTQLFYLEKTGVTAEDAVKAADFAAKKTGIRTAFLLALLEVETGKQFEDGVISAGTRIGTGNWKTDLYDCYIDIGKRETAESEKNAFMAITSGLGLDPDQIKVSKRPSYGCGGAMGPAQFLPSTWLRYSPRVSELTGKSNPSPWNAQDSFMAAAVLLADAGADAQTATAESRAAKVYISGKPTCTKSICSWYANQILSLARDIDRIL